MDQTCPRKWLKVVISLILLVGASNKFLYERNVATVKEGKPRSFTDLLNEAGSGHNTLQLHLQLYRLKTPWGKAPANVFGCPKSLIMFHPTSAFIDFWLIVRKSFILRQKLFRAKIWESLPMSDKWYYLWESLLMREKWYKWYYRIMNPEKKRLINYSFAFQPVNSFIDLGGVWRVDGAYTFYCLDKYPVNSAFLVDLSFTKKVFKNQEKYANLKLVNGNFGEEAILNQLSKVDAILMFDILLHQVNPDWTRILEMYAPFARCFLIFNPQYSADKTVRLMDLGEKEYFMNVPHDETTAEYSMLFEKPDESIAGINKAKRDIPGVWQWGITNKDLILKMESLGFSVEYLKNCGRFGNLKKFFNYAFMFMKT